MKKDTKEPQKITVKFGKKVAENITNAAKLVNHFEQEYKKADQIRLSLLESVVLAVSGLDSLTGYKVEVNLDKSEAVLIKE